MPIVDKSPSHSLTLRSKTGFLVDDGQTGENPIGESLPIRSYRNFP
jgi:hypothetical protein